jgi:hypothetical protein
VADVFDQGSKKLKDTDESQLQPATPSDVSPLRFTLHQKSH